MNMSAFRFLTYVNVFMLNWCRKMLDIGKYIFTVPGLILRRSFANFNF